MKLEKKLALGYIISIPVIVGAGYKSICNANSSVKSIHKYEKMLMQPLPEDTRRELKNNIREQKDYLNSYRYCNPISAPPNGVFSWAWHMDRF